jgi:hypothetical protein
MEQPQLPRGPAHREPRRRRQHRRDCALTRSTCGLWSRRSRLRHRRGQQRPTAPRFVRRT